ncbi:MAG TPA: patatin-like phospholipase family protein [Thermoanaerobaculia bacterium]|nr:patatin-like phospholipase family protein [Thermoanaerobaculia bacterium]
MTQSAPPAGERPASPAPERPDAEPHRAHRIALTLTGGGARAAYQVGMLRSLARSHPQFRFDVITGVSAGAINASYLAANIDGLADAAEDLTTLWRNLEPADVFRVDAGSLLVRTLGWGMRLLSGGTKLAPQPRGLVDSQPLRHLLRRVLGAAENGTIPGIERNLAEGKLEAIALSTLDWATGATITWVEGKDVRMWSRPQRQSRSCKLTIDHVLASSSLPLIFPAVAVDGSWHGDGGVRLAFPLAPAIHLEADRIIAISTRHSAVGGRSPDIVGYPPPAQFAGVLLNSIFLDQLDQDALRLERINHLLPFAPAAARSGLRPVRIHIVRPSVDLGRLAARFEAKLPRTLRFLTRGLGTRETSSPDFLSLLMFQEDYVSALIEIGERDAEEQAESILELVEA